VQPEYTYRSATADEWDQISTILSEAFNEDMSDEWSAMERGVFEPERTVLAETGGEIVGHSSAFTRDLTVPGGSVPASHVTMVGVSSLHRRRGLLRSMITRLHDDAIRRGEPIAALWASEARIYQRFGYGQAASRLSIDLNKNEAALRPESLLPPVGTVRRVPADDVDTFLKVYDRALAERTGFSSRNEAWWTYVLSDLKESRGGATALRAVVHDGPDGPDAYMLFRVKSEWGVTPSGTVQIRELVATTPEGYQAMWQQALAVDLTRTVYLRFGSLDEPVLYLVDEVRALEPKVTDSLWVRILSVPDALSARRYAAPVDVVLDVTDRDIPSNARRWRLVGGPDASSCTPTDAPADLRLDISALGAAYLGGTTLAALAAGGRVTELTGGALARATAGFRWHREPAATEVF